MIWLPSLESLLLPRDSDRGGNHGAVAPRVMQRRYRGRRIQAFDNSGALTAWVSPACGVSAPPQAPTYVGDLLAALKLAFSVDYWGTRNYLSQVAQSTLSNAPYNETHWPPKTGNGRGAGSRGGRALLASHPPRRTVRNGDHRPPPVRDGTGPARLLDMVSGRSKAVFTTWLQAQSPASRAGVETVAMDGFTGYKSAAAEALPAAVTVMDLFHVVAPAGDALDRCRQRLQQATCGHRGRTGDPLYGIRRVLRTGAELLTDRQRERLTAVVTVEAHVQGEATWGIYQRIVTAYRDPDRKAAKTALATVIDALSHDVPPALTELITLGRTLHRRAPDVLAYFDRPGKSAPPRPSTAAANTSAAPPSASATSPTTSDHCSTPAATDPDYTLFCDEPCRLFAVQGVAEVGASVPG